MNHEAATDNYFKRHPEAILSYNGIKDGVNATNEILRLLD